MRCLHHAQECADGSYTFDVFVGSHVRDTIVEAISIARGLQRTVRFVANDVAVTVKPDSVDYLLYRDWNRACLGYIGKNVGPHPNNTLSEEELANDARIEAENERGRWFRKAEYQARRRAERDVMENKLAGAPEMEFAKEVDWQLLKDQAPDCFTTDIINYAERWARLMQLELDNGNKLEDVAKTTSHEADIDGISGSAHAAAVGVLVQYWRCGDQLRRLYNLDTLVG